jgi:hypothetical protein
MRHFRRYVLITLSSLTSALFAQNNAAPALVPSSLSITNYQLVSEQMISLFQSNVTYRADLINPGAAIPAITATLSTQASGVQIVQGNLHFAPVPGNSQVTSNNTFTLLVDRTVTFSFTSLQWSFTGPVANAGPNQTAQPGSMVSLNGSGSTNPSGIGTLSYDWTFISRPPGTAAVLQFATTPTPQFTVDVAGTFVVQLTVSNGIGTDVATVTISTGNTPPVANAGQNQTVALATTVTLNGSKSTDVNGNPLTYSWSLESTPIGSTAVLTGASTVSPSFVVDLGGTYVVQLIVNDGVSDSEPSFVMITTQNTPPVANAGPPQIVSVGATVQLDGSGSTDVDGNLLSYHWSFLSVPQNSAAALSNPNIVNPTFVADLAGQYVVQLIVSDGFANSAPATVMISTQQVQPPTANAGTNQTVPLGSVVTLQGGGSDPQGLPLTFQWSLLFKPGGSAAVLSSASVANPTFDADVAGQYIAQLIVSNGFKNSQPSTVTISTTSTPPVANAGPNQNVAVGALVVLNGSGSTDSNNQPLTYSWSFLTIPNGSTAVLNGSTAVSPSFTADLAGVYVAQLIVSDGVSNSTPATVTITAAGISLTPSPLNLSNSSGTLVVSLATAAGPNGQLIKLASSNTDVATVPSPIMIQGGQTSGNATVTPVNPGTATILATATGFTPGAAIVNVGNPAITASMDFAVVGLSRTDNGQITLSGPAPTNLVVTLSATPAGLISLPANVTIAAGNASGSFVITGLQQGVATITASALGYVSGSTSVTVGLLGAISIPANVTVEPGQTAAFPVSLETGAPVNGVTINLASSDSSKVTISPSSVFIPARATTPATQPQVTGVNFGSASIDASASGFVGANESVQVASTIAFSPANLTILSGTTHNLTLNLAGFAPAGLTINLHSDNTAAATVPATVVFPANASSVSVPITGVGSGTATIHASSLPNLVDTTATVTVILYGPIGLPSNVSLKTGQSAPFAITLPAPAPPGGITVNLSSNDATKVTVTPSVSVAFGATTPATQPQVTGVAVGSASISASATGYTTASQTVQVLPNNAASIAAASGGGQVAPVNSQFGNPLVAVVKDSSNNPVQGVTVTFAGPASGASIVTATAVTNASGMASATVTANATAGPYTVNATVTGVTTPATFSLTNVVGTAASITATSGGGQTSQINKQFANPLVATVKDAGGNPVPNFTVTFTGPQTGAGIAAASAVTNAAGVASASVTANSTAGGPYTVNASGAGLTTPATFQLTNSPGGAAALTVTGGNNQSTGINTAFATPLAVKVTDSSGNPVSNVTVTFTVNPAANGAGASFAGGNTAVTNAAGVATASALTANNKAGAYTVTAAATGASSAAFNLTNTPGPAATVKATAGNNQSANINTAFATALQTTVTDSGGNPVPNVTVTFTVNPAANGAGGSFASGNTAVTNAAGVATANIFTANGKAGGYTVTAAATGASSAAFNLTNTPAAAAAVTATAGNNQTAKINTAFATALQATVTDSGGDPLSNVTVTFTVTVGATGAGGTFAGGNTAVTNASGVATAGALTANGKAGKYTVTAAATGAQSATFNLTNTPGPAATLTATAGNNQSAQINTPFATSLEASVTDSGGNPVPNVTVTFTVNAGASGAGGAFASGNTAVTNAAGVATASTLTANNKTGNFTVTASAAGASSATFNLANTTTGAAKITATSGNNQSAKVTTAFAAVLQATVTDAGGNPVPNVTVTFTVNQAANGAAATFTGLNTAVTNASGVAISSSLTANSKAGNYTVTASAAGASSATFDLTNTPGPAAAVAATAGNNQSAQISTAFTTALEATVTDSGGNPVPNVTVTFTVKVGASGASATFASGNTAVTNAAGVATASTLTANNKAGNFTVTASAIGASSATFNLTNTPGGAATVTATAGNNQSAQVSTAFATALQATVTDSAGNPLPNVTVTFTVNAAANGAGGTFAGGNTAMTNASGVATAGAFTANGKSGSYTVTAAATGAKSAIFNLTNTPGPAATVTATAGNNQSAQVSTAFATALQATVTDSAGNPLPNVTVTFTVSAAANGAGGTFAGGNTAITNASGVATAGAFTANGKAGSYLVTAAATGAKSATFNLTNTAGPAATVTATAGNNQSAQINTAFAAALQATVTDSGGNPVPNVTVTFTVNAAANGAGASFSGGNTAITNASGVATANTLTANAKIGSYTVTAAAPGAKSATFNLTNASGPPATTTITAGNNQSAQINAAFATALQVTVTDSGGNPVPNVTVTFTVNAVNGAGASFSNGDTAVTNASGVATASSLTANNKVGKYTVIAAVTGAPSATFNLTNTPGPAATVTATAGNNQSAQVSTAFATALAATVTDSGGNPVANVTVTFTLNAGANGASGAFAGGNTAVTNAAGVATTGTLTANGKAGAFTVTAAATGAKAATFNLTNTAGPAATVTATAGNNQSARISTAFTTALQATVKDSGGNPVPNVTVTFTVNPANGAGGSFAGNTAVTNAAGVAIASSFTANNKAGSYTVTAAATGASSATFNLTNTPGPAAAVTATAGNNQSAQINTAFATALRATVTDSGGNPVPNVTVTFTVNAANGAGAAFTGGNTAVTNLAGVATANTLTASGKVGSYTVTASATGATSATFSLTNTVGNPASVSATAGNNQTAQVGTVFAAALQATVTDSGGNPVPNVTVTFTVNAAANGAGGTFTGGNTAVTNASGIATANSFTANGKAGSYTVTAAATGAASALFSLTNTPGPAATVTASAGNNQSARITQAFATALQATVSDSGGNPVPNVTVTFTVMPGNGAGASFSGGNTAVTNAAGVATASTLTANSKVGSYSVVAAATGASSATFSLTNTTGVPTQVIATAGNNQSAKISTAFATPLQTTVTDSGGNPVSNVIVTFTVNVAGNGAGGSFTGGNTAVTNGSGVATANTLTANTAAGNFTVTAAVPGANSAAFTLTNTPGPPATVMTAAGNGQNAQVNTAFGTALKATVTDSGGNPINNVTVTFTVNPAASGATASFAGGATATAVTNVAGQATAGTLTANGTTGGFTVTASVTGATPAVFNLQNVAGAAASILPNSGGGQSTAPNSVFASPLTVVVQDALGNPVPGVTVTYKGPASGASIITATAVTNSSGLASTTVTANNNSGGPYIVNATVPGVQTPATFSLTNSSAGNGALQLTGATVGNNLQASITVSVPPAVGSVSCNNVQGLECITLSVPPGSPVAFAGRPGDTGKNPLIVPLSPGSLNTVFVQGLASSGQVTATASAAGLTPGTATINLAPSGFIIAGPDGNGASFTTNPGIVTPLSVISAQLDSNLNFVQQQALSGGVTATVNVTSSNTAAGTISTSPVTFTGSQDNVTTNFDAAGTGSTTISVAAVTAGFSTPAQDSTLIATVNPSGLAPGGATVGNGLEASTSIMLNGAAPAGGMTIQVTSSDVTKLLFGGPPSGATTGSAPTSAGTGSIQLIIPAGVNHSPVFYVYGLGNAGTVAYTATDITGNFGSATGHITLSPSAIVIDAGNGLGNFVPTTTGSAPITLTIESALLDSNFNFVTNMPLAGGTSASINVTSLPAGVGTITSSPVIITGGNSSTTSAFQPSSTGNATVSVSEPAPFSTPSANTPFENVLIEVSTPGLGVTSGVTVGNKLEIQGQINLGAPAPQPNGVTVTLTASAGLLLSTSDTQIGKSSIALSIPAGGVIGTYFIQAQGTSGTISYSATAPGYNSGTGKITLSPSGPVLLGNIGSFGSTGESASLSQGPTPIQIFMAQLNSDNTFGSIQALAPFTGGPPSVALSSGNVAIGTIQSPVTITGGLATLNGVNATFTPVKVGSTPISITSAGGFTLTSSFGYTSMTADVGP